MNKGLVHFVPALSVLKNVFLHVKIREPNETVNRHFADVDVFVRFGGPDLATESTSGHGSRL
jgi:hypothetical protein